MYSLYDTVRFHRDDLRKEVHFLPELFAEID